MAVGHCLGYYRGGHLELRGRSSPAFFLLFPVSSVLSSGLCAAERATEKSSSSCHGIAPERSMSEWKIINNNGAADPRLDNPPTIVPTNVEISPERRSLKKRRRVTDARALSARGER